MPPCKEAKQCLQLAEHAVQHTCVPVDWSQTSSCCHQLQRRLENLMMIVHSVAERVYMAICTKKQQT